MSRSTGFLPVLLSELEGNVIGAIRQSDIDSGRVDFHTQLSTWAAALLGLGGSFLAFTDSVHPDWSLPAAYGGMALLGEKLGEFVVQRVVGAAGTGGGAETGLPYADGTGGGMVDMGGGFTGYRRLAL